MCTQHLIQTEENLAMTKHSSPLIGGIALVSIAAFSGSAAAAVFTWDGGGADDNWSNDLNWSGGTAPPTNQLDTELTFSSVAPVKPVVDSPNWQVNQLAFTGTSDIDILRANSGSIEFVGTNATLSNSIAGGRRDIDGVVKGVDGLTINNTGGEIGFKNGFDGAGTTTKTGDGSVLIWKGATDFGDELIWAGEGSLRFNAGSALPSSGKLVVDVVGEIELKFESSAGGNWTTPIELRNANTVMKLRSLASSGSTFSGSFSGAGNLDITLGGNGGVVLTGDNSNLQGDVFIDDTVYVNNTTGSGTGTGDLTVETSANALLGGNGTITGNNVTVQDGGTIEPGLQASLDLDTLTIDNDLSMEGTLRIRVNVDTDQSSTLVVTGLLDLGQNSVLDVAGFDDQGATAPLGAGEIHILAEYGTLSGLFGDTSSVPTTHVVNYNYQNDNQIAIVPVIPEPASVALVGLGSLMLLSRRRRD